MKKISIALIMLLIAACSTGTLSQPEIEKILAGLIQDVQVLDKRTKILLPPTPFPQVVSKPLPTVSVQ